MLYAPLVVSNPWHTGLVRHWRVHRPVAHGRVAPLVFNYYYFKRIWPVALTHAVNENEIQIQILKTWEIFEFFHLLRDNLHRE
jgi:hypothetical protein